MKKRAFLPTHLCFAIRPLVVCKCIGQLCLISFCLSFVPFLVSLFTKEFIVSTRYLYVLSFFALISIFSFVIPKQSEMQKNETYTVISIVFLMTSFIITIPFMAADLSFIDAWFESVSAITTTGLSTISNIENKPTTFLFSRAWMQWYGGLGIILLGLGLAMQPSSIAKQFLPTTIQQELVGGSRHYARQVFICYVSLTFLCIVFLSILGASFFDAIVLTLASVSTGGFAPYRDSLIHFSFPLQLCIIIFSVLGACPLHYYWAFNRENLKQIIQDIQPKSLLLFGFLSGVILLIALTIQNHIAFAQSLKVSFLNIFSAQSTTGFSTIDMKSLSAAGKITIIFTMFIGGSALSTAGGLKIIRFLILLKTFQLVFFRTALPQRAYLPYRLNNKEIEFDDLISVVVISSLFVTAIFISWFIFVSSGFDPLDSLFEVVSALGTVGLSTGLSSIDLPTHLKIVLSIDMLLGRLELVTLLSLLYFRTYIGRRSLR